MWTASGPFTTADNLDYQPLEELLEQVCGILIYMYYIFIKV